MQRLDRALAAWTEKGRHGPVLHWLERELDPDGVPRQLEVTEWAEGLRRLAAASTQRPDGWPEGVDARAEGWFRALLRFSRPDGSASFGPASPADGPRKLFFRSWAERLSDPSFSTVLDWWFPRASRSRHAPPPLPADARPDRPLAVLRANWLRDGDLVAVDHRKAGGSTSLELLGLGQSWLGPRWESGPLTAGATRARPVVWLTQSSADLFEWSFRVGGARVARTAVLLRGRRLALLGEQWDGPGDPGSMSLNLADRVAARPIEECRGLALTTERGKVASARVYPLGLPRLPYPTDRGRFGCEGRGLVLRQAAEPGSRRVWRPLVVSWEPKRNRQPVHWRSLTVSENSKACPPGVAFAARLSWGRGETLVVYRSLAGPAIRTFLGHQTRARFLVGLFTEQGDVEPLVKVVD